MMKRALSIFLTCVFVLGLLPTAALAAEPDSGGLCPHHQEHSFEDCGFIETVKGQPCGYVCPVCPVQTLIDALPAPEDITTENRDEVEAQLEAIGEAWVGLSDEEASQLDTAHLEAAQEMLATQDGQAAVDIPAPLAGETGHFTVTGGTLDTDYSYAANTLTVKSSATLTISGTTTTDKIMIQDGSTANIVLNGVSIDVSEEDDACAFEVAGSASCDLTLQGENTLKSGRNKAGLQVQTSDSKTASLTIKANGAGSLSATSTVYGAGIGGEKEKAGGTITIDSGTVTVESYLGAGIGGGWLAAGGTITINGGAVTANGGSGSYGGSAGIGGGAGSNSGAGGEGGKITITGGIVNATGGRDAAGIGGGGGENGAAGGEIIITGGEIHANGGDFGAGIGGGNSIYDHYIGGAGGTITITGGTVTATGGNRAAGIGGGEGGAGGNITINGGNVTATGNDKGAGIGGGYYGEGGTIKITGGTVTATGGNRAAGIGGGEGGAGGNITISGGTVEATGKGSAKGIGGGTSGKDGTFYTDPNGSAFIIASSIGDNSEEKKGNWSGIIFDGNAGYVGGNQSAPPDLEIKGGQTLTIPDGSKLTINNGTTLTNNGTIQIDQGGTLENNGTLTGSGTFTGDGEITGTKLTQATPNAGEGYAINCTTEQITIESGYRISSDKSDTIADGPIDPGKPLYVRKEESNFYNASDWTDFTTPSRETTPHVTINYGEEALSTTTVMQYGFDASGHGVQSWESCASNMNVSAFGWNGSEITVQFRTAATLTNYASEAQEVTIPVRPAAPSGLQGQSTSFAGESDGEITGLIAGTAYQISSNDGMNWTDATLTGTKITGLASGNYRVRVKAVENSTFASKASEAVKVESGPVRSYKLEVTAPTFTAITYGDAQPTAQAITILNTGNSDATISSVTVSGSDFTIDGSGDTVTAGGSIDTWTVQPIDGLSAGEHTATITVTYNNNATAEADVKFKVTGAAQAAPANPPELVSKTYNSVTLKTVAVNSNGAKARYSKDNGQTWQDSPVFTGLLPSTKYTFVVRYGAIGNYEASPASPALEVTTEAAPVTMYSVTVNGGIGGGSYAAGATVTITADTAPDGQRFTGWTVNAGGVILTNASSATTTFTMPAQAVTVTANFETIITPPTEYTVTFDAQGGNVAPATMKTTAGKLQSLPVPTKSSHTFEGWFTQSSGGEKITVDNVFTADTTIYAHWKYTGGDSGNNSGGYTPPTTTYPPTVEKPQGGGGTAEVFPSRPERGDTVIVTPKPDEGYEVDKITVTDKNGKPVEVTVKPDGTYTFKQPNGKVKIEVSYKPVETPWNNPFADVSEGDWYYEAVRFVQEQGLMNGYSDGRFGPNDTLSRSQLAQILFNKEGRPGVDYLLDFPDVAGEAWYTEAIRWAASQGIVGGYGNGTFGPNDPITREQLAVMLWRYSGSPAATNKELHFNDTDEISGFALDAMRWAVENGILNGYGDGRLGPQGQATRAQVAQMLKNFIEKG